MAIIWNYIEAVETNEASCLRECRVRADSITELGITDKTHQSHTALMWDLVSLHLENWKCVLGWFQLAWSLSTMGQHGSHNTHSTLVRSHLKMNCPLHHWVSC